MHKSTVVPPRTDIWCVVLLEFHDVTMTSKAKACFYTESEAEMAKAWHEKNEPIHQARGWYEIDKTILAVMK